MTCGSIYSAALRIVRSFSTTSQTNAVAWITLKNYGFSDAAELFVFVSGYTVAFVYSRKALSAQPRFLAARGRSTSRTSAVRVLCRGNQIPRAAIRTRASARRVQHPLPRRQPVEFLN